MTESSCEGLLSGSQTLPSCCVLMWKNERAGCWGGFCRSTDPIYDGSTLFYLPQPQLPSSSLFRPYPSQHSLFYFQSTCIPIPLLTSGFWSPPFPKHGIIVASRATFRASESVFWACPSTFWDECYGERNGETKPESSNTFTLYWSHVIHMKPSWLPILADFTCSHCCTRDCILMWSLEGTQLSNYSIIVCQLLKRFRGFPLHKEKYPQKFSGCTWAFYTRN